MPRSVESITLKNIPFRVRTGYNLNFAVLSTFSFLKFYLLERKLAWEREADSRRARSLMWDSVPGLRDHDPSWRAPRCPVISVSKICPFRIGGMDIVKQERLRGSVCWASAFGWGQALHQAPCLMGMCCFCSFCVHTCKCVLSLSRIFFKNT